MNKFNRVLLKLSGEALMGEYSHGIDSGILKDYCEEIKKVHEEGLEMAIVIGGGNFFRGIQGEQLGFERVSGDQMGMLATVINGLAIRSMLESLDVASRLFTAIKMEPVGEGYSPTKAIEALKNKEIIILTAGTGNPFFTTDSAAALRAVEIRADVLLKGTRVDGIFDMDPEKYKEAKKYEKLSFEEAYTQGLKIMDLTAFTLCRENNLPLIVFNMNKSGNLKKIIAGENPGTYVYN